MATISILPTHVIDSLHKFISAKYPLVKNIVFDPQSGYETTIGQLRISQAMSAKDRLKHNALPLLSWNRSNSVRAGAGRPIKATVQDSNDAWVQLDVSLSSFDYKFTFMATNMIELEQFELDYYCKTGINAATDAIVRIPSLGEFIFSIVWDQNLEDIVFNLENNYYKALSGTAKISGTFLTAKAADPDKLKTIIQEIGFSIKSCRGGTLPDVYTIIPEVP